MKEYKNKKKTNLFMKSISSIPIDDYDDIYSNNEYENIFIILKHIFDIGSRIIYIDKERVSSKPVFKFHRNKIWCISSYKFMNNDALREITKRRSY